MGIQGGALMLSKHCEPLEIISWEKAITLVLTGKAVIIQEYEDRFINTPTMVFRMPSIIQHVRGKLCHARPIRWSRTNLFARDNWTCCYCGKKFQQAKLTYDHVVPRSQGGKTDWLNVVTACKPCNEYKGGRTPQQAGMKLLFKPYKPKWAPAVLLGSRKEYPAEWQSYLAPTKA